MTLSDLHIPKGIVHFMVYPSTIRGDGPILETLKYLADDDYFHLIEITHIEDDSVRKEAVRMLHDSGKQYTFAAQPCLLMNNMNLNDPDADNRAAAVETMKTAINEATEIDAQAIGFLSGKDPGPSKRDEAFEVLTDSVLSICEYAKSVDPDLQVVLETFDRVDCGKNRLVGPTAEAVDFAKGIRKECPGFSLLIDLSHLPLLEETAAQSLDIAREVLGHVHVGNCVIKDPEHPAYGDEHPPFGIEEGENGARELAEFLAELFKIGYLNDDNCGNVSFEIKPLSGQESREVIDNAKQTMSEALELVEGKC